MVTGHTRLKRVSIIKSNLGGGTFPEETYRFPVKTKTIGPTQFRDMSAHFTQVIITPEKYTVKNNNVLH